MANEKERNVVAEIIGLACDVNASGKVCVCVELNHAGLTMRIAPPDISEAEEWEWVYYPKIQAYFQDESFEDESYFDVPASEFITELKKHHPQYDADGVKL